MISRRNLAISPRSLHLNRYFDLLLSRTQNPLSSPPKNDPQASTLLRTNCGSLAIAPLFLLERDSFAASNEPEDFSVDISLQFPAPTHYFAPYSCCNSLFYCYIHLKLCCRCDCQAPGPFSAFPKARTLILGRFRTRQLPRVSTDLPASTATTNECNTSILALDLSVWTTRPCSFRRRFTLSSLARLFSTYALLRGSTTQTYSESWIRYSFGPILSVTYNFPRSSSTNVILRSKHDAKLR